MTRMKGWRKKLRRRIQSQSDKTDKVLKDVQERRSRRKRQKKASEPVESKPEVPTFGRKKLEDAATSGQEGAGQTHKYGVNWKHVLGWFHDGMERNNPDWLVVDKGKGSEEEEESWVWRQRDCANRLLKRYGAEVVKETVAWFCDNWQALKDASDGRLTGSPSINLLWASRERYFADAKAGVKPMKPKKRRPRKKRKHMVGEYDAESASKSPDAGWDDDDV